MSIEQWVPYSSGSRILISRDFEQLMNSERERERQKKKGKVRKTNEKVPAFADKQLLAHHGYETSFLKNI